MADPGSEEITVWIKNLSGGDEKAAHLLWEQYFNRMVRLARRKFDQIGINRRAADEEDIALSAMNSFYKRAADGQFCLGDRQELWKLLVTITVRKAYAELKRQKAKKRGEGHVRGRVHLSQSRQRWRGNGWHRAGVGHTNPRRNCRARRRGLRGIVEQIRTMNPDGGGKI